MSVAAQAAKAADATAGAAPSVTSGPGAGAVRPGLGRPGLGRQGTMKWGAIQKKLEDTSAEVQAEKAKAMTAAIRRASINPVDSNAPGAASFKISGKVDWSSVSQVSMKQKMTDNFGSGSAEDTSSPYAALLQALDRGDDEVAKPGELRRQKTSAALTQQREVAMNKILERRASAETRHMKAGPWYMLNPRTSTFVERMDLATTVAVVFTAVVTPFESAFLGPPAQVNTLFIVNRLVDLIFTVDMVAQFFTIIAINRGVNGIQYIADQRIIAVKYLKSWFFLDFFSTALSAVDFMSIANNGETNGDVTHLKMLRVIRVVRLAKLIRIMRGARILQRWELKISINYAALSIAKVTLTVLLYLHWSACVWGMQHTVQNFELELTWVGAQNYCVHRGNEVVGLEYPMPAPMGFKTHDLDGNEWICRTYWPMYIAALYTCTSVSTVIATQGNTAEQMTAILLMLIGTTLWAQVRRPHSISAASTPLGPPT